MEGGDGEAMRIIVGAGDTSAAGWTSLEHDQLDIRDRDSWARLFSLPGTVDAVLSEHVLEHLYPDEATATAQNVFEFLRPGGYWRIAVPDANTPDADYIEHCRPGGRGQAVASWWANIGIGHNTPDHKVFYDIESLATLLQSAGFTVCPLEYYLSDGTFQYSEWSQDDGRVRRRYGDPFLLFHWLMHGTVGTSLIVDAFKWQ